MIVGQSFHIVASRALFVWVYKNTGKSLFTQSILHASFEAYWLLFPILGVAIPDFYDPGNLAITTAILVAIVAFLWGPRTLAQYRYARLPRSSAVS